MIIGNWLYHIFGLSGTGPWYAFWSGPFADVTIPAAFLGYAKHQNCHVKGCWRLGHKLDSGDHACHRHHPLGPRAGRNMSIEELHARWAAHHARLAPTTTPQEEQ